MSLKRVLVSFRKIISFPFAVLNATLCFTVILILPPLLFIPLTLYKFLIVSLAKCVIPGSRRVLSIQESVMTLNNLYEDRDLYVHAQLNFEGRFSLKDFADAWDKRVLNKKLENGDLKFPEFRYYIDTFMGYFFYKEDTTFCLKNHINVYKDPTDSKTSVDRKKLDKIVANFATKLFPAKRSPWELLLINNCKLDENPEKECTVFCFKFHHCLADGYALIMIVWECLLQQEMKALIKPKLADSFKKSAWKRFSTIAAIIIQGIKMLVTIPFSLFYDPDKMYDKNSWHKPKVSSEYAHCTVRGIETAIVKKICADNNVSITTVIFAILSGGFRRMMETKGLTTPEAIRLTYSLPLPNHPGGLTSHSTAAYFTSCIHDSKSPLMDKTLLQRNEKIMKMAIRPCLAATKPGMAIMGSLPMSWNWRLPKYDIPFSFTSFYATVPLPQPSSSEVEFLGCKMVGSYAAIELSGKTNVCTTVCVVKFKEHFFINYGIQKHFLKNEDNLYDIEKFVFEELNHLSNMQSSPVKGHENSTVFIDEEQTSICIQDGKTTSSEANRQEDICVTICDDNLVGK